MKYYHVFWLLFLGVHCLTDEELAAFTPRHADYTDHNTGLKSVITGKDNGDGSQTIYTNGIPSHPTWTFPNRASGNPNSLKETETTLKIYSEPVMRADDDPLRCLPLGYLGIATSGVAIDGWFPAQPGCPEVLEFEELDICEGHPSPNGQYHYHHYSPCVQMPVCGIPSPIWGVALDGIPIYGPIGEDGVQLTKSDLDECGGKYDSTGRYKYHMTVDPHYSIRCFRGEIRSDVGKRAREFFCTCPFDDSMFANGPQHAQSETTNCEFNTANTSAPAVCRDVYDLDYDIGYIWEYQDKETVLAPCCPQGEDCGDSCKTEDGIKESCVQETRTIPYLTRVAKGEGNRVSLGVLFVVLPLLQILLLA